jgi:hypothetical protein
VLGYVGRLLIRTNPFLKSWFLLYLICLTIGPTLIAAGIYLCLARVVVVIDGGEKTVSRWRPRTYTLFFIGWDLASLVLQAIGGAIASLGSTGRTVCHRRSSPSICLHVCGRKDVEERPKIGDRR